MISTVLFRLHNKLEKKHNICVFLEPYTQFLKKNITIYCIYIIFTYKLYRDIVRIFEYVCIINIATNMLLLIII